MRAATIVRWILPLVLLLASRSTLAKHLTLDQRLVVACHRLDVEGVVAVLRAGADVNARFGDGDKEVLRDPWTTGLSVAAAKWTPLLALAHAGKYPDPPRKVTSSEADRKWSQQQRDKMPVEQLQRRDRDGLTILYILLSHKADLDADDGYGATALYKALYTRKAEMAKALLRAGARVNTKARVYIDGSGDVTPLHRAVWSVELTKLLLEKGADPDARDTHGKTPRDWAESMGCHDVARFYGAR